MFFFLFARMRGMRLSRWCCRGRGCRTLLLDVLMEEGCDPCSPLLLLGCCGREGALPDFIEPPLRVTPDLGPPPHPTGGHPPGGRYTPHEDEEAKVKCGDVDGDSNSVPKTQGDRGFICGTDVGAYAWAPSCRLHECMLLRDWLGLRHPTSPLPRKFRPRACP
jgi:hypothetical protein